MARGWETGSEQCDVTDEGVRFDLVGSTPLDLEWGCSLERYLTEPKHAAHVREKFPPGTEEQVRAEVVATLQRLGRPVPGADQPPLFTRLAFRQPAPLPLVRAFFADLVRLARPSTQGDWAQTAHSAQPTTDPVGSVERTTWQLGEATLLQTIDKADGNPREPDDYQLKLELALPGADGSARKASLWATGSEPQPRDLNFSLIGFTPAEFLHARAAGRARFAHDDTANPGLAADNVEAFIRAGARSGARALAEEGLGQGLAKWNITSRRQVQRRLVELTDEPAARAAEEAKLLRGDPTDFERLARVASGALVLPSWTPAAAARVLALMQPWLPSAQAQLPEVAGRWFDHPWWQPARGHQLGAWSSLRRQHFTGTVRQLEPTGEPRPLPAQDAIEAVRKTLGIAGPELCGPSAQASEGSILTLERELVRVRGMAYFRERTGELEHHWTWFWTGDALEGAVVVTRVAPPFEVRAAPVETMVTWLGGDAVAARCAKDLLEQHENLRLAPA